MRTLLQTVAAATGLGLIILATSPANAINLATSLGVRQAADALDLTQAVHCRKYAHKHGHRWSRGCRGTVVRPKGSGTTVAPARLMSPTLPPGIGVPSPVGRPSGNVISPTNPQDRSRASNPQDRTQPRAINPQDMR